MIGWVLLAVGSLATAWRSSPELVAAASIAAALAALSVAGARYHERAMTRRPGQNDLLTSGLRPPRLCFDHEAARRASLAAAITAVIACCLAVAVM